MKHLKALGLALMAIFALALAASATASATERGWLVTLAGQSAPVKVTGTSGAGTLTSPGGTITCEKNTDSAELGKAGETHVALGTGTTTFTGCKEGALKCFSETSAGEKDPSGTILLSGAVHLVNLLKGTELEPGLVVLIGNVAGGVIKLKCGTGIVEIKGAAFSLFLVTSLTADVESGTADFIKEGETCDTSDTVCKEIKEKEPLLANFSGTFEKATEETTATLTISPMVVVDD
jgi:hypothetical protein